jgi:hypothetical protein
MSENLAIKDQYDEEYTFGNTKVYVVAPKITKEENERRWERVCEVASMIVQSMAKRNQSK